MGLPDLANTSSSSTRTGCQPHCWRQGMIVLSTGSNLHGSLVYWFVLWIFMPRSEIALMCSHAHFPLACPGHSLHPPSLVLIFCKVADRAVMTQNVYELSMSNGQDMDLSYGSEFFTATACIGCQRPYKPPVKSLPANIFFSFLLYA